MICGSYICVVSIVCILDCDPTCGICNSSNCYKICSYCLLVMYSVLFSVALSSLSVLCYRLPVYLAWCLCLGCKDGMSFIGSPYLDCSKWYQSDFVNLLLDIMLIVHQLVGEKFEATCGLVQIIKHEAEQCLQVDHRS